MAELFGTGLFNDANLIDYYRLEGNSNDAKGSQNGTDTAITYNTSNGKFGQGGGFNGTTSKILLPNSANFKQTGSFTVGGWFKTSTTAVDQMIFTNFSSASSIYAGWYLEVSPLNKVLFASCKNTGSTTGTDFQQITGGTTVTNGVYHLGVGVWDGSNLRLYVDGVSDATAVSWANAAAYKATMFPTIGAYDGTAALFFNGALDDAFIFSRVLTPAEISSLFASRGGNFLPFL